MFGWKLVRVAACALAWGLPELPASAATPEQDPVALVASARACASELDDGRRLACYDKQFRQGERVPDKLTAQIAAVSYKVPGHAVVTLDNGQVWEQADADARVQL